MGVPVIGCSCAVCQSTSPFNNRTRPSALITIQNKVFLIDAGPDFRQQALRFHIHHIDGILISHAHHDHTAGLDDLRPLYYKCQTPLPALLSKATADDIRERYYYIFKTGHSYDKYAARIDLHLLPDLEGEVIFQGIPIQYMTYEQGGMQVNGFRFGNLAYLTDLRHFPPTIFKHLEGVKVLVISALRFTPSPLHFSIDEAVEFAQKAGAQQTWLTHLSHELDYEKTNAYLPPSIRLAYDGLEIECE